MKVLALLLAGMLVFAACGDDDDGAVTNIDDAESCEDVADVTINEIQVFLDDLSEMELEEFSGDEEPQAFTDFKAEMDEAEAKAGELDCTEDEMAELVSDRFDELETDGPVAELILGELESTLESGGNVFEGGAP